MIFVKFYVYNQIFSRYIVLKNGPLTHFQGMFWNTELFEHEYFKKY